MKQDFWLSNPSVLLDINYIGEVFPNKEYCLERKMNALTRIIFLLGILGYVLTKSMKIVVSTILTLIVIIVLYKVEKSKQLKNIKNEIKDVISSEGFTNPKVYEMTKDNFTNPTKQNPMMNVSQIDIKERPQRKEAAPAYNSGVEKEINNKVKEGLDPRLFKDLGDDLYYEQSMRSFYTTPNTTVPNNQGEFARFCYGNMPSTKEGDVF